MSPPTTTATATATATATTLFLLLFFLTLSTAEKNGYNNTSTATRTTTMMMEKMVPLIEPGKGEIILNESRRKLSSFQICALCTCCGGGGKGYCVPSPCCYAINCNIPNRPFGFCSFTPKSCNCFGCHL